MSLTVGSGPFGQRPAGRFGPDLQVPDTLLYFEDNAPDESLRTERAGEYLGNCSSSPGENDTFIAGSLLMIGIRPPLAAWAPGVRPGTQHAHVSRPLNGPVVHGNTQPPTHFHSGACAASPSTVASTRWA